MCGPEQEVIGLASAPAERNTVIRMAKVPDIDAIPVLLSHSNGPRAKFTRGARSPLMVRISRI